AFYQFLQKAAKETPDRVCIRFNSVEITYAQADRITDRLAKNLVAMGIELGDCIGICMPNIPQFILLYFAALKAGAVVAAINPRYSVGEARTLLNDVRPKIVYSTCDTVDVITKMRSSILSNVKIILSQIEDAAELWHCYQEELPFTSEVTELLPLLRMRSETVLPQVAADADCIYQYSGGTTGTPKAAAALHRNLVANTLQFRTWLSTLHTGEEITLAAIPLYHVYGMVIAMCVTLSLNSTILLHDERTGIPGLLKLIHEEKPTLFPAVPHLLEIMLRQEAVISGDIDLSSLKIIISGASPLRVGCQEELSKLLPNGRIVEGYGLSEAPTATHCNPIQGENRFGTIGLPLPGVDAKIVDVNDSSKVLPQGAVGELWLRSPQVMRGYHNRDEETRQVLKDGWLATGDIVKMDPQGYFQIVDRKKDLIKVSGFQVWPREIEVILAHHPKVYEAGVIGTPEPIIGEKIVAWLVMEQGQRLTLDEVQEWCKKWLASYKKPLEILFCDRLPRSSLGKLLRRELRDWYQKRSQ
ncbi:MAG: AMP-binding protein, partial [Anaerolineae bacterium]|nr:AMP-binding protein [Anaerolineae bacterium]